MTFEDIHIYLHGLKFCITSLISVISCLLRWSQLFGCGSRGLWCKGGGEPVLLVSDNGGGGNICGVPLSLNFSLSGVLSTVSSLTILSSSEEDSAIKVHDLMFNQIYDNVIFSIGTLIKLYWTKNIRIIKNKYLELNEINETKKKRGYQFKINLEDVSFNSSWNKYNKE